MWSTSQEYIQPTKKWPARNMADQECGRPANNMSNQTRIRWSRIWSAKNVTGQIGNGQPRMQFSNQECGRPVRKRPAWKQPFINGQLFGSCSINPNLNLKLNPNTILKPKLEPEHSTQTWTFNLNTKSYPKPLTQT